MFSGLEQVSE